MDIGAFKATLTYVETHALYSFSLAKKGMYTDGHERADVVHHRDKVYLPRLAELQERAYIYENDGTLRMSQEIVGRRVVIWYHDESIF